jgi:hypothetical protein
MEVLSGGAYIFLKDNDKSRLFNLVILHKPPSYCALLHEYQSQIIALVLVE